MTDSEFRIPKSWAVPEIALKAREHWLELASPKLFCPQRQEFNYIGTKFAQRSPLLGRLPASRPTKPARDDRAVSSLPPGLRRAPTGGLWSPAGIPWP